MAGGGWKAVLGSSFERAEEKTPSRDSDRSPMDSRKRSVAHLVAMMMRMRIPKQNRIEIKVTISENSKEREVRATGPRRDDSER
ncbi:hypothetical protein B296_00053256 [Ensete ventricosum]|uniref:Uncharacterized protein n=1 Tax=Ensete ventricosum TaxID=4639 RepID=A0A426XFZ4_ENSVE|nr:hypothetical protein B296_00053256 [Ensete ventricosum]